PMPVAPIARICPPACRCRDPAPLRPLGSSLFLRFQPLVERARVGGAFDNEHFDKLCLRPSPIGAAALDPHPLLGHPPLTRAPVNDDLDVLPSSESSSNLVFEVGIRPLDYDVGHPTAFPSPRLCGGDLQQKRG